MVDAFPIVRLTHLSETIGGRGAAPLGFEMRFRPGKRIEPTAALNAGFVYFDTDLPRNGGARFNFTGALGGGVRIHLGRSVGVESSYRYHHLSNGYRAAANPGFDSNLISIGVSIQR